MMRNAPTTPGASVAPTARVPIDRVTVMAARPQELQAELLVPGVALRTTVQAAEPRLMPSSSPHVTTVYATQPRALPANARQSSPDASGQGKALADSSPADHGTPRSGRTPSGPVSRVSPSKATAVLSSPKSK